MTGDLCVVFAFEALRRCLLRLRGVSTTAELVRFRTTVAEDGDLLYYPVVAFTLPNGVEIEAEGEGVSRPPHGTQEGDRTEVVYDPAVPSSIVLERDRCRVPQDQVHLIVDQPDSILRAAAASGFASVVVSGSISSMCSSCARASGRRPCRRRRLPAGDCPQEHRVHGRFGGRAGRGREDVEVLRNSSPCLPAVA